MADRSISVQINAIVSDFQGMGTATSDLKGFQRQAKQAPTSASP